MTAGTMFVHFVSIRTDLLPARFSSPLEPSRPLAAAPRIPTRSRGLSVTSGELDARCQGGEETLSAFALEMGSAHEAGTDSGVGAEFKTCQVATWMTNAHSTRARCWTDPKL